jgi:alkylhydroperoxidase family enzyme
VSWIKVIEEGEAEGPLREAYAAVRGARGEVANILKIHSVSPAAMSAHLELYQRLMFGASELTRVERETIAVAVSALNACHY